MARKKSTYKIIARNVEGGADSAPPPALLGLRCFFLAKTAPT